MVYTFGGNPKGGKISGKDTECLVLSPEFKLPDDNQVLLRVPRENNMYNVDLKNIVPSGDLTCLFAKAILDESNLWHRRLGHINFKTMNKLFCRMKGIKREFSVPRTPQQNGIAERKNRTLIKAARTMLADSLLPILFWAEAVNTVCYVQNRVLVTKPQNKTPYELLLSRTPNIDFMRPFGCLVTILNTLDPLGSGPTWLFDIDTLSKTMNYQPVTAGNQSNPSNTDDDDAFRGKKPKFEGRKPESEVYVSLISSAQTKKHNDKTKREAKGRSPVESLIGYRNLSAEFKDFSDNSINEVNAADSLVPVVGQISTNSTNTFSAAGPSNTIEKGIDYEEFFVPVSRIEAVWLLLDYASFMGFMVYLMDVKSAFLYGTIKEEVYVCQSPGFEEPDFRFTKWSRHYIDYIKLLELDGKSTSTPIDTKKPLLKDPNGEDVDVHTYRSMIGSLMYLTSSRPYIMFA
nr:ribonuclease H-like domain-containing protein [Tanacetum cinerariifolium]